MDKLGSKRLRLGVIASKANSYTGWKKFWNFFKGIYIGGALRGRYQKDFSGRVGWSVSKLTILNAVIFGGIATLEYLFLGRGGSFILYEFNNLVGFSPELSFSILRDYAYFNIFQSSFRILGALFFKVGMMSFSIEGLLVNLVYPRVRVVRKRFSDKFIKKGYFSFS